MGFNQPDIRRDMCMPHGPPMLAERAPVPGQLPENHVAGRRPSYPMVKAGTWGEDHCQPRSATYTK